MRRLPSIDRRSGNSSAALKIGEMVRLQEAGRKELMRTSDELRAHFLRYFEERGHRIVKSSSLVPGFDPTLLFTNAGMVQFKDVFTGAEKRDYSRAASSQKCVRAGGKHNDLENVGRTARHHTFFEMLGNFSFGDYFKQQAIEFAWDFLTREIGLDKQRFHATVYREDEDAFRLWTQHAGLPAERVAKLGEASNFWSMGESGPCGPCSELVYDQGPEFSCGRPDCGIECDCDRYLELWNLVFMQFERSADGSLLALPRPSIDTGMGLERLAAVVQGRRSNFESDLLMPLIEQVSRICGKPYGANPSDDVSMRVIADHARATAHLVADCVLPSNEGRGYVLRRIMRRAIRHGEKLGINAVFFGHICEEVVRVMGGAYPEIEQSRNLTRQVTTQEEERFRQTLTIGIGLLEVEIEKMRRSGTWVLAGEVAFRLYDTFGFPLDLTEVILAEAGMRVDAAGFEAEMEKQRSRGGFRGEEDRAEADFLKQIAASGGKTAFTGYWRFEDDGRILGIVSRGRSVSRAEAGDEVEIVLDQTPFYGESGGQVGDAGWIEGEEGGRIEVTDCTKPAAGLHVQKGKVIAGAFEVGSKVKLRLDVQKRQAIMLNHTATHILQFALRAVLGTHVKQSGSLVGPERLRFDYTHFAAPSEEQLRQIEALVNGKVREDVTVEAVETSYEEAVKRGAIALFGEKYGERVRMVKIGAFSLELCGGTHATRSGEIGLFKIVSEGGIAAGVRRMEAVTGEEAVRRVQQMEQHLADAAGLLKVTPSDLVARIARMREHEKELQREIETLRARLSSGQSADLMSGVEEIDGTRLLAVEVEAKEPKELREMADVLRQRMGSGVVLLAARKDAEVMLLLAVTEDLKQRYHAGNMMKELAQLVEGSGGGKPALAQAGGRRADRIGEVMVKVAEMLRRRDARAKGS